MNKITSFEIDITKFSKPGFILDLSVNKLEVLDFTYFYFLTEGTNKIITVYLSENPLSCNCTAISWYGRFGFIIVDNVRIRMNRGICKQLDISFICILVNTCNNITKKLIENYSNKCNISG